MPKFIDRTGKRYGKLVAVKRVSGISEKCTYWLCRCDCGESRVCPGSMFSQTSSMNCGCEYRGQTREQSALKSFFATRKANARNRGIEWNLSIEFVSITTKRVCFYCGEPPARMFVSKGSKAVFNGLDRVDSTKGYLESNVVACCWQCNQAKASLSQPDFLAWICRVYNTLMLSVTKTETCIANRKAE